MASIIYIVAAVTLQFAAVVHGAGEVVTSTTLALSLSTCGDAAGCKGTIRLCANTVAPATSGNCLTFESTNTVAMGAPLIFSYSGATLAALGVTLPGTYVASVRQDVTSGTSAPTLGIESQQTITLTDTTDKMTIFMATNGANTFTVPVVSTVTCSTGTSGSTCTVTTTAPTTAPTTAATTTADSSADSSADASANSS